MVSQVLGDVDRVFASKAINQSEKGQFFTPKIIADQLATDLLDLSNSPLDTVHDLGCGPGSLSEAVSRFHPNIELRGYDIDNSAIDEFNNRFPDTGVAVNRDLLTEPKIGPINAVISNPPYLLSRRLGAERTGEIRETGYFSTAKGKLNTFSLFIELAIRELAVGGVAAFIVPIGVTNLADHGTLRNLLIEECEKIRLTWLTESNCFKEQNVSVETCLLGFRKGSDDPVLEIREWDGRKVIGAREINPTKFEFFPTLTYLQLPEQSGVGLSEEFDVVAMGFNWREDWQEVVSQANPSEYEKGILPIIRGKDVSEEGSINFEVSLNYPYLEQNGAIVRPCDFELHSSTRPRLIAADITSGIKVGFTDSPCLPMNSVKVIYHKEDDIAMLQSLRNYLMSDDANLRLKEGAPNLHLTKGNLERLKIPNWREKP